MQRYGHPLDLPLRLLAGSFGLPLPKGLRSRSIIFKRLLPFRFRFERWGAGLSPYLTPEAVIGIEALCIFFAP